MLHNMENMASQSLQICIYLYYARKKLPLLIQFQLKNGNFFLAQYKYIQICKLCEAIFSMSYNISPPNLAVLLILGCSF